jgi:hypothetical protein
MTAHKTRNIKPSSLSRDADNGQFLNFDNVLCQCWGYGNPVPVIPSVFVRQSLFVTSKGFPRTITDLFGLKLSFFFHLSTKADVSLTRLEFEVEIKTLSACVPLKAHRCSHEWQQNSLNHNVDNQMRPPLPSISTQDLSTSASCSQLRTTTDSFHQ